MTLLGVRYNAEGKHNPGPGHLAVVESQPVGQPFTACGKGAVADPANGRDTSRRQRHGNGKLPEMR